MKRTIVVLPLVAMLTACGSTGGIFGSSDPYERRAEQERERQEKYVERALDKAPKWMTELPKSNSAVYANGTAVSGDMSMSANKAKTIAYGKICMAAGGRVDQQTKMFRMDSEVHSTEQTEMAIKSSCPGVDISGAEVVETKVIAEGTRFRSYVLVALPTGEANAIQRLKEKRSMEQRAEKRSQEAFKELERNSASSAPVVPTQPSAGNAGNNNRDVGNSNNTNNGNKLAI